MFKSLKVGDKKIRYKMVLKVATVSNH